MKEVGLKNVAQRSNFECNWKVISLIKIGAPHEYLACLFRGNEDGWVRMRIILTWALFFLSMTGALPAQSDSFAMRRALQRYTEVYGGGRDADALTSISIEGTQEIGGEVYDFLLRKKRPNSLRYRISREGQSVVTAYDGISGWMQIQKDGELTTRKLTRDERIVLKEEAIFEGPLFRHLESRRHQVEMTGLSRVEGRDAFVFQTREASGRRSIYYLDTRQPHVLKVERLGADDKVVMTTHYRDYRDVNDYPIAFEVETLVDGEVVSLVKVDSVTPNPGLLSFYFRMPE